MDVGQILIDALRTAVGLPAAAYALAAVGLNLHFGYTGLLNFGHVGFLLVGSYGAAITVERGGPLWLGVLVGLVAAVALGLVLGLPTLRLRADYLAIVTIAAAEILRLVARARPAEPLTLGVRGIEGFAVSFYDANPFPDGRYGVGSLSFSPDTMWVLTVGWVLTALATILVLLLMRSPWGRVLRSIREDEDAARSLGKNVFGYKLQSLVVGGVIAALAGILLSLDRQFVNPDFFSSVVTFAFYAVLILGGPASTLGPVAGAVVYWFVISITDGLLREALEAGWFGTVLEASDVAVMRFALVGLGLILLMVFRPQGMFGNRREVALDER
jgi:branched-chain amino acid transport system permease protein